MGIGTLSVVGVGDGWRMVLDSFCSCCLIWSTSETSWRQWWQSALGTDCCGCAVGWGPGRCSAARSLLTSFSRIFTRSDRTCDLVDASRSCESFRARSSLHMVRARCESSRARLSGVKAGPDIPFFGGLLGATETEDCAAGRTERLWAGGMVMPERVQGKI